MFRIAVFLRRFLAIGVLLSFGLGLHAAGALSSDEPKPGEPTDPKARKTYESAREWQKHHDYGAAMDDYRKANKQDGGHCKDCLRRAYLLAMRINAYKDAEGIARDMLPQADTDAEKAGAHYRLAIALQKQGIDNKKEKCFSDSCEELKAALAATPELATAHYSLGISLAHLHQDDAARQEFNAFLDQDKKSPDLHDRAQRYLDNIELARAKMAPPFSLTTLDGQRVSMDGLAGKVVLIDFWATWCGPCREALPHVRQIAQKFAGQPFVVLSVSLDNDESKWRDFVGKNGMTWLQYRDGGFNGQIAKQFNVTAIPATFTIDADGVLEDQHVGDAAIEGKLKKLIARASEVANRKPVPSAAENPADTVE
jgi:thiol-disulfide isomerase/thioredoxin